MLVSRENPRVITAVIDWEGAVTKPIWDVRKIPPIIYETLSLWNS
jgi:hypothetical protein